MLQFDSCYFREEHIARKVDQVVAEAKAKLAKGDKKGALEYCLCLLIL